MTSTGSSPTFRGVRLLDESIFSLLIGPPEEVTNIPAQISARGHRSSPFFFEMNSSDLVRPHSHNIPGPTPAQISARGYRSIPFSEMNSSKDRLTSFPPPRIGRVHFAIGRVHFDVSHWLGPTFQAHAQSSCYKVRQQSSHHRQMQPKRRD